MHIFQVPPAHYNRVDTCSPALENSFECLVWVFHCRSSNLPRQRVSHPFLVDALWSILLKKKIRAYRQSFSAWRWAAEVIRPLHWDLKFDFECPRAVRFTWTKWHWKLVHSPYQHPSTSCLRKKMLVTGFPVLVMNFQPLFADSLTSTLLDWLGYATGFSVPARLHSHIQFMLESVLSLYVPAVMVLEVMYQTSLTSKRSSINPGPR